MFSIISRCIAACGSGTSPKTTRRRADENSSGCLDANATSSCLVTAQNPGQPSPPPSACQYAGACRRSQEN